MSIVTDYGVMISGSCRKCDTPSTGHLFDTQASFATPVFPGHIDQGLARPATSGTVSGTPTWSGSATWGCHLTSAGCWTEMRESERWTATAHVLETGNTGRVWADHDYFIMEQVTTMSGLTGTTLSGMLTLGADYLISEPELQQYQNNIQPYMSFENVHDQALWSGTVGLDLDDSELCTRILRNVIEAPTWWGGEGEYVKYNAVDPEEEDDFSTYFVALSGTGYIPYGLPLPTASGITVTHIVSADWPD